MGRQRPEMFIASNSHPWASFAHRALPPARSPTPAWQSHGGQAACRCATDFASGLSSPREHGAPRYACRGLNCLQCTPRRKTSRRGRRSRRTSSRQMIPMLFTRIAARCRLAATRVRIAARRLRGMRNAEEQVAWDSVRAPLMDDDVVLQSPTHIWLRDLSRAVHPVRLCRHHPRLANRLAKAWRDPRRAERLLHDLIFDRRPFRRGFEPRIAQEIDRLYRYNAGRLNPLLRAPAAAAAASAPVTQPGRRIQLPQLPS